VADAAIPIVVVVALSTEGRDPLARADAVSRAAAESVTPTVTTLRSGTPALPSAAGQ
jgi:hypothetical protein